ncbi:MAG: hypothetical protein AAF726_15745, partial [Planctomycetota bacterium]
RILRDVANAFGIEPTPAPPIDRRDQSRDAKESFTERAACFRIARASGADLLEVADRLSGLWPVDIVRHRGLFRRSRAVVRRYHPPRS